MKARVPHAYFWHGNKEYGTPEVEFGVIRNSTPQPPGPRVPPGMPIPGDNSDQDWSDLDGPEDDEDYAGL